MNLNQMKKIARKSDHKLYQHCTLLFSGSRLLTSGHNTGTKHAEIVALRKLDNHLRLTKKRRPRNLHLVNFMVKRRTGKIGNSKPCPSCMTVIRMMGIKSITYTREDGSIVQI